MAQHRNRISIPMLDHKSVGVVDWHYIGYDRAILFSDKYRKGVHNKEGSVMWVANISDLYNNY